MKIAVIGAGISGLSAAWLLSSKHSVAIYEAADYLGGHTNTVDVTLDGVTHPVDTGFLVHNELTYPNLIRMFDHLGVRTYESDMSFSVHVADKNIEWAGSNLQTVFAQRQNLVRLRFLRMLKDILAFNAKSEQLLTAAEQQPISLGEMLEKQRYSEYFRDWYLLPMAAAIWSSSPKEILNFPAETFLRFCINHRLLTTGERPKWRSIYGGGRAYVEKLAEPLAVKLNAAVERVERKNNKVTISANGESLQYDAVVMATHAPDTLNLLADTSSSERRILGAVSYQQNLAVLHTDSSLLPKRESLWSAWNYLTSGEQSQSVCVSYLLNKLQKLPFQTPLLVTLNPPEGRINGKEIARYHYQHPVFDRAAIEAQKQLPLIQGLGNIWYCGAWTGYGFHEDGLKSALRIMKDFGVTAPWPVYL